MGSPTLKVNYSSEVAKSLKGLVDIMAFNVNYYANAHDLDIFRTKSTLPDGSTLTCLFVHGAITIDVNVPVKPPTEEIVTAEIITISYFIVLSSGKDETYLIPLYLPKCTVKNIIFKRHVAADFFTDEVKVENKDLCAYAFSLTQKSFIITTPDKIKDDWHNNIFINDIDLSAGQRLCNYFDSLVMPGEVKVCFSFSPYTYVTGLPQLHRYVEQSSLLYIPVLGVGTDFTEKYPFISQCDGLPFGKKPFTRTKDGISSYREVVRSTGNLILPTDKHFKMSLYYPFIPYIHEIPYLLIQAQKKSDEGILMSMQDIGSLSKYGMHFYTDATSPETKELRTDEVVSAFPPVQTNSKRVSTFVWGIPTGEITEDATQDQILTHSIRKSNTIGTVGDQKDLFVETTLSGVLVYDYDLHSYFKRDSNFPGAYYDTAFVIDGSWPCGSHDDKTDATSEIVSIWNNKITGQQQLKVGDLVTGDISLVYEGVNKTTIAVDGEMTWSKACPSCVSIGYVSQQMGLSQVQNFKCLDKNGDEVIDSGCIFAVVGGGSITPDGVYSSSGVAGSCSANNAQIQLICQGVVIAQVAVAVTSISLGYAYNECHTLTMAPWNGGYCCFNEVRCDGTTWDFPTGDQACRDNFGVLGGQLYNNSCVFDGWFEGGKDVRTPAQIANGCCPQQLL